MFRIKFFVGGVVYLKNICLVAFNQKLFGDVVFGVKLRFPRFESLLEGISVVFVGVGIIVKKCKQLFKKSSFVRSVVYSYMKAVADIISKLAIVWNCSDLGPMLGLHTTFSQCKGIINENKRNLSPMIHVY